MIVVIMHGYNITDFIIGGIVAWCSLYIGLVKAIEVQT